MLLMNGYSYTEKRQYNGKIESRTEVVHCKGSLTTDDIPVANDRGHKGQIIIYRL